MKRITNNKLYNSINSIRNVEILTGWGEQARYNANISIGKVMALQNYGFKKDDVVVPARPFMDNCINNNQNKWKQESNYLLSQVVLGKITFNNIVNQLKLSLSGDLAEEIQKTNTPPNAPSTIKKKGFNKPLIDTGTAIASITSEAIYV